MLYDVKQVCDQLRISRSILYELFASGKLKFVKLGRRTLVADEDLRAFVDNLRAWSK
jgi:excisionase family DNA binding protein